MIQALSQVALHSRKLIVSDATLLVTLDPITSLLIKMTMLEVKSPFRLRSPTFSIARPLINGVNWPSSNTLNSLIASPGFTADGRFRETNLKGLYGLVTFNPLYETRYDWSLQGCV